ncbi:MAG TPA: dihydrodipicolinate synthase family protein [Candidatus Limnocylindrales bacterium]|nr:dihydrodipicolinate synthase family protein [Candidatus Limnocylindrales bacterium]
MSISPDDLGGIMAMMPAFATDDAASSKATATIDVDRLEQGVGRVIDDGIDLIATTGSFGEFHTLLEDEYATLARATVQAAARRVPVFIGCTALNTRDAIRRARVARDAGADGLLVGVPFYFPSTVENAVGFYRDVAAEVPDVAIMIYHNPTLHHVTLPIPAMKALAEIPNVIAMKDAHRETRDFTALQRATEGKIRVFVAAWQFHAYHALGAAGFWSYDCWMGPEPVLALRDAIAEGRLTDAADITLEIYPPRDQLPSLSWRETLAKIAIRHAGYIDPGPLRPPFVHIPPEIEQAARDRAARWLALSERYARQLSR